MMKQSTVISAIHQVLKEKLNLIAIDAFHPDARLNEDLYLDSVMLLQLLLGLEVELGIEIPDSALNSDDFKTVSSLADFMLSRYNSQEISSTLPPPATPESQEVFEDIKVHCFVSCLCEVIKADQRVDHRPFYFGVWDAEVFIDKNYCLQYHSPSINHDFFKAWYEKLYSVPVISWYRPNTSKAENINTLIDLLDNKPDNRSIMVMLDLFRLPERENKFNQNPFPHYVMLEKTNDSELWFMSDPDFRWEGTKAKTDILHAIESAAVAGGYYFDSHHIRPSSPQAIHDYFLASLVSHKNPMTHCVRSIVAAHTHPKNQASIKSQTTVGPEDLGNALVQLPVLAIRKYAYEHGLAFFWRSLKLDDSEFEYWCEVIEDLVSTYKQIQYRAMKLSQRYGTTSALDQSLLTEINLLLNQQDEREFTIKARLQEVFTQWCQLSPVTTHTDLLEISQ